MAMVHSMPPPTAAAVGFVMRLAKGAAHNFAIRVSDWFASWVMLTFGFVVMLYPRVFDGNPWYGLLENLAPPATWGLVCWAIGMARVGALTVNGTFPSFRWSPHLRFMMAMTSCFVWFQITLGLIIAQLPTIGIAVFPHLFVFDLYNVFLAASEAGVVERQHRNGRK